MSKKRMTRRVFAVVFALLFMITGVTIPTLTPQAATEMDLSSYITMSGKTEAAKDNGENKGIMISELIPCQRIWMKNPNGKQRELRV